MYYENELFENLRINGESFEEAEFVDCEFVKCVFENCTLYKCSFNNCRFTECQIISLKTKYSQIEYMEFFDCSLVGVYWYELIPSGRIFEPISKISNCFLKYNTFTDLSFMKFDFSGNVLQECTFDKCNLKESKFTACQLGETQYTNCDMRKADFRDATSFQIDIHNNKLKDAKFSFPEVINLLNSLGIKID